MLHACHSAWRKKAESSKTVIEIFHGSMELVHDPDVQLEIVQGGDSLQGGCGLEEVIGYIWFSFG